MHLGECFTLVLAATGPPHAILQEISPSVTVLPGTVFCRALCCWQALADCDDANQDAATLLATIVPATTSLAVSRAEAVVLGMAVRLQAEQQGHTLDKDMCGNLRQLLQTTMGQLGYVGWLRIMLRAWQCNH